MSTPLTRVVSSPVNGDRVHGHAIADVVHKTRDTARLVQGWRPTGSDRFVLALRAADAIDPFFRPDPGAGDLMTLGEVVRQAGLLLAQLGYGVPADWAFVMSSLAVRSDGMMPPFGSDIDVTATCLPLRARTGALRSMVVDLGFARDGRPFAQGQGRLTVASPRVYRRMRPPAPPVDWVSGLPRVPHRDVGRTAAADVLLGRDDHGHLRIAVDTRHPIYFDHPGDHLPGMTTLEAVRQAYVVVTGGQPASFIARFDRYLELRPEAEIAPVTSGDGIVVDVLQGGNPAARVALAPPR